MCDVLWPCDNSAEASTSFKSTFNQLTSSTSNYITTNSSSASSSVQAYQEASIKIKGTVYAGCDIDQSQTVDVTSQTGVNLDLSSTKDLRDHIITDLENAAKQHADATSSTMGGGATTATNTEINQTIQNVVNKTVSDSNYVSMSSAAMGQQNGKIEIDGDCFAPIRQDQKFAATVLATNIMKKISNELGGLGAMTTSKTTVDQEAESYTKGPIESFTSMFESYGVVGGIICLICVLMSCAGCAFLAFMMFKK